MKLKLPARFVLIVLSFFLTVLLYVDRASISTAKEVIMHDIDISITQFGWIMAVFTLGYSLFQTPSGAWVDKFGPRKVITGIVAIWSTFTAITGSAWNYVSMLVVRFLFGAGEAGAFPALAKASFYWFPVQERGIVQGINFSGSRLGAALAMPLVAGLISEVGWRATFLIFGIIGIGFSLLWYIIFRDKPEHSRFVNEGEKKYILENRQKLTSDGTGFISTSALLKSGNLWGASLQYICSNFTFYFALTWMYPYIKEKFDMDSIEAGFYASIPLISGALGNWFSGYLVDAIYKSGHLKLSRRFPAITGFILSAAGMVLVTRGSSPALAVAFMSLAVFGADMTLSPSWSFCIDVGKNNAGLVSGVMNMAGNLGAFFTIIAFPYLFKWTMHYEPFFFVCAILSVIAIILWCRMNPEKVITSTYNH